MANTWFRMHHDAVDDEKLRLLAFEDRWHFFALLCCKSSGLLDSDAVLLRRKVAVKLGLDLATLDEVARRLDEVGLIDKQTLQPKNWDKRQYKSDTSTDRVREYRSKNQQINKKKKSETDMKRFCNVSVTPPDTDTDTDTEADTETTKSICVEPADFSLKKKSRIPKPDKQKIELPSWLKPEDWESLVSHRKSIKSPMTLQAQKLSIAKLDELRRHGHDPTEVINQTILNGWKGLFPLRLEQQQITRSNKHDERAATIEALTGRSKPQSGRIIDITPADAVDRTFV